MSKKHCCCNMMGGYPMVGGYGGYPGMGGFGGYGGGCGGFGGIGTSPCSAAILLLIFWYSGLLCNNKGFILILLFLLCGGFCGNRGGNVGYGGFAPRC